ncbi:MAG: nucleotidyltransferase family protein [Actinomycetota bacterium]|nr:nucleotidyltransferase family protein [Actinomycetota bacterium]
MEAIILAGGKAERLGDAAGGQPKALVDIAGRPLISYQLELLRGASVRRVIVSCAAGQEETFTRRLADEDIEIVIAAEPEPLGRGGGIRFAARSRSDGGPIFALNGDELIDVDLGALLKRHEESGAAATIVVSPLISQFGIVEVDADDVVRGFTEAPRLPHWVNSGVYVLGEEALGRFPARGDHESSTFPDLAREGRLRAYRHDGVWLTVNTPKELRKARDYLEGNPDWLNQLSRRK